MRGKQRTTLWKRIRSRVKGLAAVIMAVALVIGLMPVSEVLADEPEKYYFVQCGYASQNYPIYFGKGNVSDLIKVGDAFTGLFSSSDGKYLNFNTSSKEWTDKCTEELNKICTFSVGDSGTLEISNDTTLYYGATNGSGGIIIVLNGTSLAEGSSQGDHKSTTLPAGKFSATVTFVNGYADSSALLTINFQ